MFLTLKVTALAMITEKHAFDMSFFQLEAFEIELDIRLMVK